MGCLNLFELSKLAVTILVLFVIYKFSSKTFNHWKRFGIKFVTPTMFFGNSFSTTFRMKTPAQNQEDIYHLFPNEEFVGMFLFRIPILMIRNPEVVYRVLTRDFAHFYDRGISTDEKLDLLSSHLINLRGQRWKSLRNKITPAFSSGKLKSMCTQLEDCAHSLSKYFKNSLPSGLTQNVLDVMARFATDVIGSCVFGLNIKSLEDADCPFRKVGKAIFKPSPRIILKFIARAVHPMLPHYLNLKFVGKDVEDFFLNFVKDKVKENENMSENKNFLNILMDLRKNDVGIDQSSDASDKKFELDDQTLASNVFAFFLGGFETVSSTMSFFLFELAANKKIQDDVRSEILKMLDKHNGEVNYETIKELEYTSMVISETLRKYPIGTVLLRECTQAYQVPDSSFVIEKGTRILIPVYALHHDPKYFQDPERFDPERFSSVNKANIVPGTYLPFGDGPRICIGLRFALMEMKYAFCKIIPKYDFALSTKTKYPIEFKKGVPLLAPADGIWLNIREIRH